MASLNVAEWSPDQVADWLSGLGPAVERYVPGLRARGLCGARLLTLRCDDLEALGVRAIGHQELVLEGLDHLRNFQYEVRRECVQQLALRVSVVAESLARALRGHTDGLETQSLADVARTVHAVKPLASWLARAGGAGAAGGPVGGARGELCARAGALLALALEAATCAQRDRFAEQPARAVRATAAAAAAAADHIIQQVADPLVLQPAALDCVTLRQAGKPLGFTVLPSCCGHAQLADIRFGSPAHASGAVHDGDEIVQVGGRCVVGWSGEAVVRACRAAAARGGELSLRLRRRGARPPALTTARPRLRAAPRVDRLELVPTRAEPLAEESAAEERAAEAAHAGSAAEAGRRSPGSSDSEPLSPPASPTQLHPDHTRLYPPKPRAAAQRRHSVSGGSPARARRTRPIDQLWQELAERRWRDAGGGAGAGADDEDTALYRRDKAVSCSTGLELSPRPRTCLGAPPPPSAPHAPHAPPPLQLRPAPPSPERARGKLDKAHSTPAYDFDRPLEGGALAAQPIPESPTTPPELGPAVSCGKAGQILGFKASSCAIGEAMQLGRRAPEAEPEPESEPPLDTVNIALLERRERCDDDHAAARSPGDSVPGADGRGRGLGAAEPACSPPEPPPRPPGSVCGAPAREYPVLRPVRAEPSQRKEYSVLKPVRSGAPPQISVPLRHLSPHDLRALPLPLPLSLHPAPPATPPTPSPQGLCAGPGSPTQPPQRAHSPGGVRGMFPSSKTRSLKKKSSLLAKRRQVPARALAARGASGAVWQRVRAQPAHAARWARRHLLLAHNLLYAYREPECSKADCMIYLEGFTVCAASEVRSRAHAFKVYHTGKAFYFACESREAAAAWVQLIHRATLLPRLAPGPLDVSTQYSETDYSSESDCERPRGERREREKDRDKEAHREKDKEKDKSKFGSLKKLTGRVARSESQESVGGGGSGGGGGGASLDRKYLRFFSRRARDDAKPAKSKQPGVPVPTEHYRSYRRVPPPPSPASPPAAPPAAPAPRPPPLHYIHASNPNLLDFDKSELAGLAGPGAGGPGRRPPAPRAAPRRAHDLLGFVTLEEFMLKKQEEERRQVYTNRVLMGIERTRGAEGAGAGAGGEGELAARLQRVVPDVIYGERPPDVRQARSLPRAPVAEPESERDGDRHRSPKGAAKPISVKGKDGYEKLVYPEELNGSSGEADTEAEAGAEAEAAASAERLGYESIYGEARGPPAPPRRRSPPGPERWRDSLRRNDKVSAASGAPPLRSAAQYSPLPLPLPGARPPLSAPLALPADSWGVSGGGGESGASAGATSTSTSTPGGVARLRLMFGARAASRDDKTERPSPAASACGTPEPGGGGAGAGPGAQYPHLQCPPTFQPETYSLARLKPAPAAAPVAAPAAARRDDPASPPATGDT